MAETSKITQTNVEQFTLQAKDYAGLMGDAPLDRQNALRAAIEPRPEDELLDIACGSGGATLRLAGFVRRAVGVDITPAMLDEARAAQARTGIGNIEWRQGEVEHLPFADASFDIVVSQAAFHHFEDGRAVLAEMTRVCRPGGRIAIHDVAPPPEKVAAYDRLEIMRDPSHTHAHTLAELRALAAGLPLTEKAVLKNPTPFMPLKPVLTASRPTEHSIEEIYALLEEDARTSADHWGFGAKIENGAVMVTYPMAVVAWTKL